MNSCFLTRIVIGKIVFRMAYSLPRVDLQKRSLQLFLIVDFILYYRHLKIYYYIFFYILIIFNYFYYIRRTSQRRSAYPSLNSYIMRSDPEGTIPCEPLSDFAKDSPGANVEENYLIVHFGAGIFMIKGNDFCVRFQPTLPCLNVCRIVIYSSDNMEEQL
jgi:hypothetical protein